jgi:glycosyltransferase involved in cell wall biosynthesis
MECKGAIRANADARCARSRPRRIAPVSDALESRVPARTLAGATILQIVPALREEPVARTAVNVAHALLQWGARALIAAEGGPLVNEITAAGGEWIPLANVTVNPFKLRNNARVIEQLIAFEHVDIVHAHSASAVWSARIAAAQITVWLVTTLPDVPSASPGLAGLYMGALAQGDRIIAPSHYAAAPMMKRYRIPAEQVTVIPRGIDTALFNPAAVRRERAALLRNVWRVARDDRMVLVPGRVAAWNGQIRLPEIARRLLDDGIRDVVFVIAGEHHSYPKYAHAVLREAKARGVDAMFRLAGHCPDMPSAFAAADIVAVPATAPPVLGLVAAQAQAMGRPVVTTDVGVLPERVAAPPLVPESMRTGWVAAPGDAADFARALGQALSLDVAAYRAMSARARQFADYMFSPASVAVATRAVYTSLLARDL